MRKYSIFFVAALPLLLASFSTYSASVALPVIVSGFNTDLVIAGWVLTIYALVQTVVMPLSGKISEALGRRLTFFIYLILFISGSILCALSVNVYMLIGSRVIQALGGGGFMPSASRIVSDAFPEDRQRFIGLLSSFMPIGMIIGPNLGGWMTQVWGWRSIFWFNVPIGIATIVLALFLLPRDEKKGTHSTIDLTGAGLLFSAIFAFMFGITQLGKSDIGMPLVIAVAFLALGIVLAILFLQRQRTSKQPIIDMQLLREKRFLASNIYNFLYGVCFLGIRSLIPLYFVTIYKMSTLQSGVLLTPWSVVMIGASTITSFRLVKWGYRRPILIGTALLALGFMVLALQPHSIAIAGIHLGQTEILLIIMGICGLGHGICTPAANNACIELLPDKVATITGLRGMFRQMGGAIGVAIATVVLHSISNDRIAFMVVLFATVAAILISIPNVFIMPELASACSPPQVSPQK